MYTKESVLNNSPKAKALARIGQSPKGVLTNEEQNALCAKGLSFQVITNGEVYWFTDDFQMCHGVLGNEFGFMAVGRPCPIFLSARRNMPSRMISTAEKFTALYRRNERQITSVDELLDYLNSKAK